MLLKVDRHISKAERAVTQAAYYHWRELPQVSFCHDKSFVVTNTCCHDKHVFVAIKYICRSKIILARRNFFLWENILLWQNYVCCNKYLSWQKYVCHNKHTFVVTKDMFCCNKHVCHDCLTKLLLQQKWYLWQLLPMIAYTCTQNASKSRLTHIQGSDINNTGSLHLSTECFWK